VCAAVLLSTIFVATVRSQPYAPRYRTASSAPHYPTPVLPAHGYPATATPEYPTTRTPHAYSSPRYHTADASAVPADTRRHTIGIRRTGAENVLVESQNGRVNLIVREALVSEVLNELARSQNLNLVSAGIPESRISVSLTNQSLDAALNAILGASGLTWTIRNDVIYVTSLSESVAPELQGRELVVIELDYASADDVKEAITGLLSPVGQVWINQSNIADNRRNKEIVTVEDIPQYLTRVQRYIAQIDQPPRQVLIEVHVLEVELKHDDRHGVNFQHVANLGGLKLDIKTSGFANPAAPQAFFVETSASNLTALLEALKTSTDAKTLASPRIMAINGQESNLQVGEQLGFRVTTTTETSTLESVEFLNVGVVLTVTPHISRDGRVLMQIRPKVSTGEVNPSTGLPEEETTEVQTDVLLGSGQGVVIGGLIQETDDVTSNKYLGLGELRWIGPLFQRREAVKGRREIVVALVPHVLPLSPCEQERNDFDVMRGRDPLLAGALNRFPRPYEPRLPDPCLYRPRFMPCHRGDDCIEIQRLPCPVESSGCNSCDGGHSPQPTEILPPATTFGGYDRRDYSAYPRPTRFAQQPTLRRLPPIPAASQPRRY
jgi:type IV pilus assembly protein PilQ